MKWILLVLLFLSNMAYGQLVINRYFSSNMILQRDQEILLDGKGIPNTQVVVKLGSDHGFAIVKKDSSWSVRLPSRKASLMPITMKVSAGKDHIQVDNILIGDLWLITGQSNMEFPLKNDTFYFVEKKNLNQSLVRLCNPIPAGRFVYGVPYGDSLNRRMTADSLYKGSWTICDSLTAPDFSAIGYYFAKSISGHLNIPIGVINLSIGGAPIETFISRASLSRSNRFKYKVQGDWLKNDSLPEWIRERGMQNVGENSGGYGDDLGLNHAYKPGFAYAAGIATLNLKIKGILWYQGESNAQENNRVEEYPALQMLMINDYREHWHNSKLPFYWVQLSSVDTTYYKSQLWAPFRNGQLTLWKRTENTGMVVSHDYGKLNNVHPINKKIIGERMSLVALHNDYHINTPFSGPIPVSAKYLNGKVVLTFNYVENKLKLSKGVFLKGFSLDGEKETAAFILGKCVEIPCKVKPAIVYYSWQPYTNGNLVNSANLPAPTFKISVK